MKKLLNYLVSSLYKSSHQAGLKRFAQTEYSKDWQYAYYMMLGGQKPNQ